MEYLDIVWQAFWGAFSWCWSLITINDGLWTMYVTVIFVGWIINLFLRPFFQGAMEGSGSDWARDRRDKRRQGHAHISTRDHQKRLPAAPGRVKGDGFTMRY